MIMTFKRSATEIDLANRAGGYLPEAINVILNCSLPSARNHGLCRCADQFSVSRPHVFHWKR